MRHSPEIEMVLARLGGWCSPEKRAETEKIIEKMMPRQTHPNNLIVELGVFSGGWLIPAALAAATRHSSCAVIGIDPYSVPAAIEGMSNAENIKWWGDQQMLERVYQD